MCICYRQQDTETSTSSGRMDARGKALQTGPWAGTTVAGFAYMGPSSFYAERMSWGVHMAISKEHTGSSIHVE